MCGGGGGGAQIIVFLFPSERTCYNGILKYFEQLGNRKKQIYFKMAQNEPNDSKGPKYT